MTENNKDTKISETLQETLSEMVLSRDWSGSDGQAFDSVMADVLSELHEFSSSRQKTIHALMNLQNDPFAQSIIQIFAETLFADGIKAVDIECAYDSEKRFMYNNKEIDIVDETKDILMSSGLLNWIDDSIQDILFFGSKGVACQFVKDEGLKRLSDEYAPAELLPAYYMDQNSAVALFSDTGLLRADAMTSRSQYDFSGDALEEVDVDTSFVFQVSGRFLKMRSKYEEKPIMLHSSQSVLLTVMEQLQSIRLDRVINNVQKLKELSKPSLISLELPSGTEAKNVLRYVRQMEKFLNTTSHDVNLSGSTESLEQSVSSMAGSMIKVLPVMSNGKGTVSNVEKPSRQNSARESELIEESNSAKRDVLNSLGIPEDMYFSDSEPSPLRSYVRFYRRIKRIQRELTRTISKIMVSHFKYRYNIDIDPNRLDIRLTQTTDIEKMDAAESINLAISNVNDLLELQATLRDSDISSEESPLISNSMMREMVKQTLTNGGLPLELFSEDAEQEKKNVEV